MTREEAIEKVKDMRDFIIREHSPNDVFVSHTNDAIEALKERPHGEWIYNQYDGNPNIGNWHCSECRHIVFDGYSQKPCYNFCPNCGANMIKRGLRAKMGLIDDAADAEPDFECLKVGNTIYTQDDDKQGWTGREEK